MSREYTNKLLEMIEDQLLSSKQVITAFCKYMSEADIQDMMEANGFVE